MTSSERDRLKRAALRKANGYGASSASRENAEAVLRRIYREEREERETTETVICDACLGSGEGDSNVFAPTSPGECTYCNGVGSYKVPLEQEN